MKKLSLFLAIITMVVSVNAQSGAGKLLKKAMTLKMPRTVDDDMPGTRGASVAWHPLQKKYYAAMAGNVGYPLGVYDINGKLLSRETLNCEEDVRGLWFNPQKKQVQGNTYNENGWFSFKLDVNGIPESTDVFLEGMNQPDAQSVGAYNTAKQEVIFLNAGFISFYSFEDGMSNESVQLQWGRTKKDGALDNDPDNAETPEDYNYSTVVYTGVKGSEIGVLNITEKQVELYSITDGFMTKKLKLPEEASTNSSFNFAYTNGMYWLFNMDERTWTAYK
jgi:hypothetical protein